MANDQGVVGSIISWMDVTNASYYIDIHEQNENKGSQIGHTKQINKK
jgi:hypothetical protein